MKVFYSLDEIPAEYREALVTIGNFDGVHLGHVPILNKLHTEALQEKKKSIVITFDPHPKKILRPEINPFYLINTLEEKISLIERQGIDAMVILPFSIELSYVTAEHFICNLLWDKLRIKKIFIGHDYRFGKNKVGNEAFLKDYGKKLGFEVEAINSILIDGQPVSSTRLRFLILEGKMKEASLLLGRPYNISGVVVKGRSRGSLLGFPTANIIPDKVLIPAIGVYAVFVQLEKSCRQGVLNIGFKPTFDDDEFSIEVYIIDFDGNIYDERLNILFIDRIREEVKFGRHEELIDQIKRDIDKAKVILNEYQGASFLELDLQRSCNYSTGAKENPADKRQ